MSSKAIGRTLTQSNGRASGATQRMDGQEKESVRSVERVAQILGAVASGQDQGRRLTDLASELGLPPASAHRLLSTLVEQGLIEKPERSHRYFIGQEVFLLALSRRNRFPVRALASPHLDALSVQFGETIFLTVRNELDSICIDRRTGTNPAKILYVDIGNRRPLGISVGGISLMQGLNRQDLEALLAQNSRRIACFESNVEEVRSRVLKCRRLGFASLEIKLAQTLYRGISVPIVTSERETIGAIGLGAIASRMDDATVRRYVTAMQEHAIAIACEAAASQADAVASS